MRVRELRSSFDRQRDYPKQDSTSIESRPRVEGGILVLRQERFHRAGKRNASALRIPRRSRDDEPGRSRIAEVHSHRRYSLSLASVVRTEIRRGDFGQGTMGAAHTQC